ncbi:hypothetical protein [Saccharolobus caldissimus]|uniref:Uncharacterized protein n=1 Tax=Saccharolobus caldissimus TaxID=1702097 RepID=A0AAQ4CMG2_9CREN|nr:hypothetical protein [Saccharolobus caldissimus]BDB96993.1 hypothetical protein SACC_00100 [Saccharolobus caldissimus]
MKIPGKKFGEVCYADKYYGEYTVFCLDAIIDPNNVEFNSNDLEQIVDNYEEEIIEILRDKGYRIESTSINKKKTNLQNYKKLEEWL